MAEKPSKKSLERARLIVEKYFDGPLEDHCRWGHELWVLVALEFDAIANEYAKYKFALEHHLCKYEIADWLACDGVHGDYCDVCEQHKNDPQHYHATLNKSRQQLVSALRETAHIIHFGRFHQWKDFEKCTDKDCERWRALLSLYAPAEAEAKEKP